jgi:hypothetical protein
MQRKKEDAWLWACVVLRTGGYCRSIPPSDHVHRETLESPHGAYSSFPSTSECGVPLSRPHHSHFQLSLATGGPINLPEFGGCVAHQGSRTWNHPSTWPAPRLCIRTAIVARIVSSSGPSGSTSQAQCRVLEQGSDLSSKLHCQKWDLNLRAEWKARRRPLWLLISIALCQGIDGI